MMTPLNKRLLAKHLRNISEHFTELTGLKPGDPNLDDLLSILEQIEHTSIMMQDLIRDAVKEDED